MTPDAISERLFGESLDRWWEDYQKSINATVYKGPVQVAFFIATFAAMGRLCKSDGRIRDAEIRLAGSVMDHLELNEKQKRIAIRLFNEGKQGDFDVDSVLGRFYRAARHRPSVLQIFVEIQLQAAVSDAPLNDTEEALLLRMCKRLDVSRSIYMRIKRRIIDNKYGPAGSGEQAMPSRAMSLTAAAELLGVSHRVGAEELKTAYRRQMSRYHPDKMQARGCTQEELELATSRLQQIKRAYEIMDKARKLA